MTANTVVPAKAGTHNHQLWNMGPRFRGDDRGNWYDRAANVSDQPLTKRERHTRAKPRGNECSRSTPEFVISKSSPVCTPAVPSRVTTLG